MSVYCKIREEEVSNKAAEYCPSFIPSDDFDGEKTCDTCEWGVENEGEGD